MTDIFYSNTDPLPCGRYARCVSGSKIMTSSSHVADSIYTVLTKFITGPSTRSTPHSETYTDTAYAPVDFNESQPHDVAQQPTSIVTPEPEPEPGSEAGCCSFKAASCCSAPGYSSRGVKGVRFSA